MHADNCTLTPRALPPLLAGWLLLCQGCVQVASSASVTSAASMVSSASSSELVSSPFRSSSRSSGEQQQQQQEIEGLIIVLLQRGAVARETLYLGLADVAGRHGISDWEADAGLWLGVGGGLAGAGVDAARARGYARDWSAGAAPRAALVIQGYQAAQARRLRAGV